MSFDTNKFAFWIKRCCNINSNVLRTEQEFNAAVQAKFEDFKEAIIEQIKSNLKEIFKEGLFSSEITSEAC